MNNKNLCIIQARMGATRLPEKVLKEVGGVTLLEYEINRVKQARNISKIVVATTDKETDDRIEKLCKKINIDCFRGSEDDVLDRYYQCALKYSDYKNIIRITADCPLIDPRVIDKVVLLFLDGEYDYTTNVLEDSFPDGMDIEIFKKNVLKEAAKIAKLSSEREHVTLYIRNNKKYKIGNLEAPKNYSQFRLTVDEPEDFAVIEFLIKNSQPTASYLDYINILKKNPKIMQKNMHINRNEGLIKSLKENKKYEA